MDEDMLLIDKWATGRAEDLHLVALLARSGDTAINLAMSPQAAIALGEELAQQGLRLLASQGRVN